MFSDKFVFRFTYISIIFSNLIMLLMAKITQNIFLEIVPFIMFGILILTGLHSFSKSFTNRMANNEGYVHNLLNYAFPPEIRFMIMIVSGLTFSYVGYNIYGFLIILAGAGDATLQKNIFDTLNEKEIN